MSKLTYTSLINQTLEIYLEGKYKQAYDFITEYYREVTGNLAQIYNFRYTIANMAGDEDLALELMREAIEDHGFWYQYEYLMEDEDLKSLRKYDAFHELIQVCKEREAEAKKIEKPQLKVMVPEAHSEGQNGMLIALHGDQENIGIMEEYWSSATSSGCVLGLPQSSDIQFSQGYQWDDVDKGTRELVEHYKTIMSEYDIDENRLIVGGFSAGARIALHALLKDKVPAKGFIVVAPWLPEIDQWAPMLDGLKEKDVKGYVICGDSDEDCYDSSVTLVDLLKEKGIPHQMELIEDLDHDYPEGFDLILEKAIAYIMNDRV